MYSPCTTADSASLAPTVALDSSFATEECLDSERSYSSAMPSIYENCIQSDDLHQQSLSQSSEMSPGGARWSYVRLLSLQTFAGSWTLDDDIAEVFGCPLKALQAAAPLKVN